MSDETESKKGFWRKPSSTLWAATAVVTTYGVWCVLLSILTATGLLLGSQNIECGDFLEFAQRPTNEARLVYIWAGVGVPACLFILLEFWRRHGHYFIPSLGVSTVLVVLMACTLNDLHQKNYEFKCCGFASYRDWRGSIPASCSCAGEHNGCLDLGNSFIHDQPCLPAVLALVDKRSFAFNIITYIWLSISAIPAVVIPVSVIGLVFVCFYCCYQECECSCDCLREKRVPVVFIGKNNNNNQTDEEEEDRKEEGSPDGGVVLDMADGWNEEGEEAVQVNGVTLIPVSLLARLQAELDPPPVQHWVTSQPCLCIDPPLPKKKAFHTVLIEEGSPLLPSGAVVVDLNKPMQFCRWDSRHHGFDCRQIVWPKAKITEPISPVHLLRKSPSPDQTEAESTVQFA
ncbi:uncharacterized protein LOC115404627 [Salarias fasciatus]|uniref:uncharacterized protein LOC115404627 n=1 Tax=Salarias fasciatus TaxID=181472 RepID=UPI001176AB5A|nr:uncharacterized protein LOC115404627 [Salarias fasciatus]